MSIIKNEPFTKSRLEVCAVERSSFTDFFLTGNAQPGESLQASARAIFTHVAETIAEQGIQVILEKIYGLPQAREELLELRNSIYRNYNLNPDLPITFVEQKPVVDAAWAGLQLWGIVPHNRETTVNSIKSPGGATGRCWTTNSFRMLYLPDIHGMKPEGKLPDCATGQARQMLANASNALKTHGLGFSQVVRTWIYLGRILDWYGEFNRVRTEHFTREGLERGKQNSVFPASTGIQGKFSNHECFMDLLALELLDPQAVKVQPIRSTSRQPQAYLYGSAFSRGMSINAEGKQMVFVSGTASINAAGETVYAGNPEAQCLETLLDIGALLNDLGGGLENICLATLFCKNPGLFEAYQQVSTLLKLPAFPTINVQADVCRHELLVEMEVIAII